MLLDHIVNVVALSSVQVLAVTQLKYEQFHLHKVSAVGGLFFIFEGGGGGVFL